MKTYFTVFRVISMILLIGLIALLIVFHMQNWEIPPIFFGVLSFLAASIVLDILRNR